MADPTHGKELTHNLQLQTVEAAPSPAPTPEEALATAKALGLTPVQQQPAPTPQGEKKRRRRRKPNPQKSSQSGDKDSAGTDTPDNNIPLEKESNMQYSQEQLDAAIAAATQPAPSSNGPLKSVPSGLTDRDRQEIGEMLRFAVGQTQLQPQAQAGAAKETYFDKFNGVSVGERLVVAGGYGVITILTFAGCMGVGQMMGVPVCGASN
jgi:hypothetical protein